LAFNANAFEIDFPASLLLTSISDKLYPVYGSYSHAGRVGDLVFLYGTVGFDAHGRLPGDIPGQADMVGQGGELWHVYPW
jgi:hypothetical protein